MYSSCWDTKLRKDVGLTHRVFSGECILTEQWLQLARQLRLQQAVQPHQAGGVWLIQSVDPMVMAHFHNSLLVKLVPLSDTMWGLVLVGHTLSKSSDSGAG